MEKNKLQHLNITTDKLFDDIRNIIEQGRRQAYAAAGQAAIMTYWNVGRRIVEEEQQGESRAAYGSKLIPALAYRLSVEYGSGYGKRNLLSVSNIQAREWYMKAAAENMWSFKELERNISTQYYERRLAKQLGNRTLPMPQPEHIDPLEYIKNPMVAEFMGFQQDTKFSESELEQALIDNLEKFIMELGRGFAFVERQQHIVTDTTDFYIDLVFYNFKMKRFVIFELKTHKLTHQDIGQLDMYVRMYDDLMKEEEDNPTIGVLLCTDTDDTIAKYSVLHGNEQLFAAKYMAYMPTEEELARVIEQQKRFFLEQHGMEE